MSNKDFSKQIHITSPCEADWDSMIGTDQIRLCSHCQLSVNNLEERNRKQVMRLITKSEGRVCVRYSLPTTRSFVPAPARVLHKIGRRTSAVAAGDFTSGLGISSVFAGTLKPNVVAHPTEVAVVHKTERAEFSGGGTIRGVVFDPNGAVIPGATVLVTTLESRAALSTSTTDIGEYRFGDLAPGTYNLRIEASGFATSDLPHIVLRANDDNRVDQTLSIASITAEVEITSERMAFMGGAIMASATEPLVKAAQEDDLDGVREALLATADVNVRDKNTDSTALELAVRHGNREMVQILLWAKVDVNRKDSDGQTVLMMVGEDATSELVWDLLNAGAKVNVRDHDGDTALIEAAQRNNVEIVKTLLDAGARVNGSNNNGQTALMLAAGEGLVNNVRTLILAGADINVRDLEGNTALMYADRQHHSAAVRLLKSHGALEFEGKGQ